MIHCTECLLEMLRSICFQYQICKKCKNELKNLMHSMFYIRSDMSCRSRLAVLNEKLTVLERRIDYLEACVTKGETLT